MLALRKATVRAKCQALAGLGMLPWRGHFFCWRKLQEKSGLRSRSLHPKGQRRGCPHLSSGCRRRPDPGLSALWEKVGLKRVPDKAWRVPRSSSQLFPKVSSWNPRLLPEVLEKSVPGIPIGQALVRTGSMESSCFLLSSIGNYEFTTICLMSSGNINCLISRTLQVLICLGIP